MSVLWLYDIKNNTDPVFIVIPDKALVCVGCIGANDSVALEAAFGGLVVRNHNPGSGLQSCGLLQSPWVFVDHLICIEDRQCFYLRGVALRVYFLSDIHILPVAREKFFQVLVLADESLACRGAQWSCSNVLRHLHLLYRFRSSFLPDFR